MTPNFVKKLIRFFAPKFYFRTKANRNDIAGESKIGPLLTQKYGCKVLGGPFKDMAYVTNAAGSSYAPKLIGSYECELNDIIKNIISRSYDVVVDVGCAEGYYAVGLALHLSGSPKVYAFDIDSDARVLCKALARQNLVENKVIIESACTPERLTSLLQGNSLIVCDCEGYELDLLDPTQVPSLKNAEMLIELHDCFRPGLTPQIVHKFEVTHQIKLIDVAIRNPADFPSLSFLSPEEQRLALMEFRPADQQWAYLIPKQHN